MTHRQKVQPSSNKEISKLSMFDLDNTHDTDVVDHHRQQSDQAFLPSRKLVPLIDYPQNEDLGPHVVWVKPKKQKSVCRSKRKKLLVVPKTSKNQIVATAELEYSRPMLLRKTLVYPIGPWKLDFTEDSDVAQHATREELQDFLDKAYASVSSSVEAVTSVRTRSTVFPVIMFLVALAIGIVISLMVNAPGGALVCIGGLVGGYLYRMLLRLPMKKMISTYYRTLIQWITQNRGPLYAKGIKPRPGFNCCYIIFEANYEAK
mmetsp:Transcript_215/g.263  ORF Transcript_215/g.263 Transcript_215/m.263 type:complete len:261 (+) Transcript_215:30-812(+)